MAKRTEATLNSVFIFNSSYGPREGEEHKKILYYYPRGASMDSQITQVGLCEAVVKFTQTFTDHPSESLHTQKTRQLFLQPEENFWLVMVVNLPFLERVADSGGSLITEYLEDDIQDHVHLAVLRRIYNVFRLFNGSFSHVITKFEVTGLKQRLSHFFDKYLPSLRVPVASVMDTFCGIQFLPLDKNTYLRVHCFINQLEAAIPEVAYSVLLYNDQLVWSGLEQDDIRILYNYVTTNLFPAIIEQDLQSHTTTITQSRFLLGPPNMNDESNIGHIPRVHLNSADDAEECHLVVYRAFAVTICLLVCGDFRMTFPFLKKVHTHLSTHMPNLASDICESCSRKPPQSIAAETQFRYVYFNRMNLAQKTSLHTAAGVPVSLIPPEVIRLVADVNFDINNSADSNDAELLVKTATDFWVIGKKCDQREVYIVINQKNANLIEINEEVKRICSTHFSNIFFLD